jgi:cytochrome c oxidase subunit 1
VLPVLYFTWSLRHGPRAGGNPWGAKGLEWQTRSPPPVENFDAPPEIPRRPYDYDPAAEEAERT